MSLDRPGRVFLIASLAFGFVLVFVTPPFQAPDEGVHFFRAFAISQGHLVPQKTSRGFGDTLPANLESVYQSYTFLPFHPLVSTSFARIRQDLKIAIDPEMVRETPFSGASAYSFVPYLPQSIGIFAARLFRFGVLGTLYAGRVANLVTTTLLIAYALSIIPLGGWLLASIALTPMCLFQRASVSPDGIAIAASFLLIALVIRLALGTGKIDRNAAIALLACSVVLLVSKPTALPLIVLIIPAARFSDRRWHLVSVAAFLIVAATVLAGMSHLASRYFETPRPGASPAAQMAHVKAAPLKVLSVIYEDLSLHGSLYFSEMVGRLGWMDTRISSVTPPLFGLVLILLGLWDGPLGMGFLAWQKLTMLLVGVLCVFLVSLALYVSFTLPGATLVDGLQGRYWLPFSPLFFFLFRSGRISLRQYPRVFFAALCLFFSWSMADMFTSILVRYYGYARPW